MSVIMEANWWRTWYTIDECQWLSSFSRHSRRERHKHWWGMIGVTLRLTSDFRLVKPLFFSKYWSLACCIRHKHLLYKQLETGEVICALIILETHDMIFTHSTVKGGSEKQFCAGK